MYYHLLPSVETIGTPYDDIMWAAVLRSTSAFEMYRKRFQQISPDRIVEFLVLDREFPRAIHYCVLSAEVSLHAILEICARHVRRGDAVHNSFFALQPVPVVPEYPPGRNG
jgi:uncharacterized alpha-E superfamily protein